MGTNRTLHADADGAVAEVRVGGLLYGVVVAVDDLVQVAGDDAGDLGEAVKVKVAGGRVERPDQLGPARGGGE